MKKYLLKFVGWLKRKLEVYLAKENENRFYVLAKELSARQKAAQEKAWINCDHVAGCSVLSDSQDVFGRTSIIWHRTDIGVDHGICTVCQRQFLPSDSDYAYWRGRKSFNKMSAAGVRTFFDPKKAYSDVYGSEKGRVFPLQKAAPSRKDGQPVGPILLVADRTETPDLESLSDEEIKKLFNEVRELRRTDPWFKNPEGSPDEFALANIDLIDPSVPYRVADQTEAKDEQTATA